MVPRYVHFVLVFEYSSEYFLFYKILDFKEKSIFYHLRWECRQGRCRLSQRAPRFGRLRQFRDIRDRAHKIHHGTVYFALNLLKLLFKRNLEASLKWPISKIFPNQFAF